MALSGDDWKGGNSADRTWQEGYDRLGWQDQAEIRELADEKYDGDKVEAMKERFKGNIAMALNGKLPPLWQLYSEEERVAIQEANNDAEFRRSLENLLTGLDGIDDETVLPPVQKNSKPKAE